MEKNEEKTGEIVRQGTILKDFPTISTSNLPDIPQPFDIEELDGAALESYLFFLVYAYIYIKGRALSVTWSHWLEIFFCKILNFPA